ncbi:MAG TPA: glycosyltransferase family 2 protein [Aquabacterium sp.]|uniref:glycosyltransferase family 2 protein n=1 Tax=Aquabacterium sp. TaxID=1872578 RepID=UPI002E2F683A|nr:glycosyltransferase family 2 protein [Aquabacterium sp.]HEX5356548.1 glycosyltransferase family 2 protein [Aquabacterium sp.]
MPRIALVMIARDEARCIVRCLRSVRPWVDDMIVLDTGSTDQTIALAKAEGAQVHHFTWIHDFAAARNAALACSDADWNLILDADETLDEGGPLIAALRTKQPDFIGRIDVRSSYATDGQQPAHAASSWLPRVLPKGVRYEGRVHEQPVSPLPRHDLAVTVGHDGYMPAQMLAKGSRNQSLLKLAVAEQPQDAYLHYQLGKDEEVHDRFDTAWQAYAHSLQLLGPQARRDPPWRHDLILRSLYTLKAKGQADEAIHLAQAEMPNWPDSPDFFFVLGDVLLDLAMAQPAQAGDILPMVESAWRQCLSIGENPALEGAVHGRGSYLARHNLDLLLGTMAAI